MPCFTIPSNAGTCVEATSESPCGGFGYENNLNWETPEMDGCTQSVGKFEIFFSPEGRTGPFESIATTSSQQYTHTGLSSHKGCYYLVSSNFFGDVSAPSETVCFDNCPDFRLPNVFSPNADGHNDSFVPFPNPSRSDLACLQFVNHIEYFIFDQSGSLVYKVDEQSNRGLKWDGNTQGGAPTAEGIYFYSAVVEFDILNPDESIQTYKGWVQLLR